MFTGEEKGKIENSLLELSKDFATESDLRDVAIKGLEIPSRQVEKHIKGNNNDINAAAYNLFREWLHTQEDLEVARDNMNKALEKAEKPLFKNSFNQT